MSKPTVKRLDEGQLEMMRNFLRMGYQKPNIPALKENLDAIRQMMIQKTAGQGGYSTNEAISFDDLQTHINCVVIEAMCLYLSGELDKLENDNELKRYKVTQCEITWDDMTYPEIKQKLKEIYGDIPFLSAVTAMYWQLMSYKQLKEDYTDLDNKLRTANTENDELKRMLRLAVDTMDNGSCSFDCQKCERLKYKGGCGYDGGFKWRHHDEAMELLGGTERVD